ncbi:hypothetical protein Tco_0741997 [Tanacetum coccineum]
MLEPTSNKLMVDPHGFEDADVLRMDRLIGGSADGSSTSGSADGSLVGDASIRGALPVLINLLACAAFHQLSMPFLSSIRAMAHTWRQPSIAFAIVIIFPMKFILTRQGKIGLSPIPEVLTLVLDLGPSVSVFRAFYTRMYSDGLFLFAKRSLSAPSCLSKPPDSIKNWADHFFWVDSRVFPISVPLNTGGVLEKDPAPHLTTRQEQLFRFFLLIKLPSGVQAVEVQKGEEQVTLFDSIKHCFVSLDAPAAAHQASGSGSWAGAEISAPSVKGNVVEENVIPGRAFLDLTDPDVNVTVSRIDVCSVVSTEKAKIKKLLKVNEPLPAKRFERDHPSLDSGKVGIACLSEAVPSPKAPLSLGASSPAEHPPIIPWSRYILACHFFLDFFSGMRLVFPRRAWSGLPTETSEESTDSFYETAVLNSEDAKRWYIPRWNITNDSLLDDGFSCRTLVDRVAPPSFFSTHRNMDYDQLFEEFNVGAARQICLGSEVRSRAEHELELKEKLRSKYDARGVLLREKDAKIARLKSLLQEKETESARFPRLRGSGFRFGCRNSLLTRGVGSKACCFKEGYDIALLEFSSSYLKNLPLNDSQAASDEPELDSSLSREN